MKLLLGLVITILAAVVIAQRSSTTLESMNWSTSVSLMGPEIQIATKKDLLVVQEVDPSVFKKRGGVIGFPKGQALMAIRRRNAEGVYEPVGNFTEITSPFVSTNGKWVAVYVEGTVLFNVDNNNVVSNSSYVSTYGGYLLSDDTFVGYDPSPREDGNYTFRTYQYEASNNTWNNIPGADLNVTTGVNFSGDFASYRATDTHLVFADLTNTSDIHVHIYSRQADKSWMFVESVPVNSTFSPSVNYNGVDTLTISNSNAGVSTGETGVVFTYTKINSKWTEQTITTSSVGYSPEGNFGGVVTFLDANTLLVTADLEGYDGNGNTIPNNVGKVLVMTRNSNGMWEPTLDLNNPTGSGLWGSGVGVNDYDIIVPSVSIGLGYGSMTFYSAPLCFMQPVNATCNDQQLNDCSNLTLSSLYTINNAQCGAVSPMLNGLSLVNNKAVQAHFLFSKGFGPTVACDATVTCPAPPSVVVQPSPSKVSSAIALIQSGLASLLLGFILLLV